LTASSSLGAVLAHTDDHEQAQTLVLTEPHADVDAVDKPVRVLVKTQLPLAERLVLGLPALGQPCNRARRQAPKRHRRADRRFNGHHLVVDVLDGVKFKDGIRVTDDDNHDNERTDEKVAA
jgi:hypothetical protein